ncbi:MAG TPA: FAD-binding protein [Planctomycetota bacterium]|nr:FAD-binding protein [Planctomycetota bacterium]HRR81471.1 FAD-binding protein [Planctomycetota bacterium]HRT93748.1 FAD-binding protein [Planctomycetota bacterium]
MLDHGEQPFGNVKARVLSVQTLIIGSGAAGLNCAEHLHELGMSDLLVVTDQLGGGTSYNSGSDKQTYYKIGVFGDVPDSPMEFARTLTAGGMMHGDLAYIEGLGSAPEFFHLVRNGVPFPFNAYGAFVGYKTDHDPRQRATSAGPKTSQFMVARSLAQVRRNATPVLDRVEVIRLLTAGEGTEKRVIGAVALELDKLDAPNFGLLVLNAENVVMATGGPGEMYRISVYPHGQIGNHGLALEIGAVANNLAESQFGLASTKFRWNLSGTYQQVIPCYFSTDAAGRDRRYFLNDYFETTRQVAANTFLKGYQWPFHAARLQNLGSSVVDIAVANEVAAGRRVFMDFLSNPVPGEGMGEFSLADVGDEARRYLERSGALQATPYERLAHMNPESIELYAEHGIDLREPLECAVCAQHNNGGLRGSIWWESNIRHLFPIGELNGAHGVRPGGSALNSGQVGGLRAAQRIQAVYHAGPMPLAEFRKLAAAQVKDEAKEIRRLLKSPASAPTPAQVRGEIQDRMSADAAFLRSAAGIGDAVSGAKALWAAVSAHGMRLDGRADLPAAIQNVHLTLTHVAFLQTIQALIERGGGSRGGYMILDEKGDLAVKTKRGSELPHRSENMALRGEILETRLAGDGDFAVAPVPVRPLPNDDSWYETTWRQWLRGEIFKVGE